MKVFYIDFTFEKLKKLYMKKLSAYRTASLDPELDLSIYLQGTRMF